ncbi:MAG: DUF3842 family protein [Pseudomonadota bacterium]
MKRICVIDGQGGGIGSALIKSLKARTGETVEIIALGANDIATAQMLRSGANRGASGENPICVNVGTAHFILGPVGISWANAMTGEITPRMAEAVMSCPGVKIFIPLFQGETVIVGTVKEPLPHLVEEAINLVMKEICNV